MAWRRERPERTEKFFILLGHQARLAFEEPTKAGVFEVKSCVHGLITFQLVLGAGNFVRRVFDGGFIHL